MKIKKRLLSLICIASLVVVPTPSIASSDAQLASLWVSGPSVIDFEPSEYDYDILVPYGQDENGEWELVLPEVHAQANDTEASVEIEKYQDKIEISVTSEDESTKKKYALNVIGIGENMYTNGGFENGTDGWKATAAEISVTQGEAAHGDKALLVTPVPALSPNTIWETTQSPQLLSGKTYYASSMIKIADASDIKKRTSYLYFENFEGDIEYFGTNDSDTSQMSITNEYKTAGAILKASKDCTTKQYFTEWGAYGGNPPMVADDYYLGELSIANVKILDTKNDIVNMVEYPQDGESSVQLTAKAFNQFNNTLGIDSQQVTEWNIIGEPSGVSISNNGLLTVTDKAQENAIIYVEAIITPSFNGCVQEKVHGVAAIKIGNPSAAQLQSLLINGSPVVGFSPKVKNYQTEIADISDLNGNLPEVPVVTAIPYDPSADVEVTYPEKVGEGSIKITVTSTDGIENIYIISIKVLGQNMYTNGGFEESTSGWTIKSGNIELLTDSQYSQKVSPADGKNSALITGNSANRIYYGDATLNAGKVYIASSKVRLAADKTYYDSLNYFEDFKGDATYYNKKGEKVEDGKIQLSSDWQQNITILKPTEPYDVKNYYTYWGNEPDMVVDSYYISELIAANIEYEGNTKILLPQTVNAVNEEELSGKIYNQLGLTAGLENAKITWKLAKDYDGVSIDGNKLKVSGKAHEGKITLLAEYKPEEVSSQTEYVKSIVIDIITSENDAKLPRADNVKISGKIERGNVISAVYDYYQVNEEKEGNSSFKWYYSDGINEKRVPIDGENDMQLTITESLENKYISFSVTPVSETGKAGKETYSNYLLKPTAPKVERVFVSGVGAIGNKYTGIYDFIDENEDNEGESTYRWLLSDSVNGIYTPIEGATTKEYVIREEDKNKYIRFEVTPISVNEPYCGNPMASTPILCATTPTVSDVKIKKVSAGVYSVTYKYSHIFSIPEGKTSVRWMLNGKEIGEGSSVTINENSNQTLKVAIIPAATLPPYYGDETVASINITSEKTTAGKVKDGGTGGGGGAGGSKLVPAPQKTNADIEVNENARYWASDAIDFVTEKKFMDKEENGTFNGKKYITRGKFLYSVMKTLDESEASYSGEFSDVSASDKISGMLQRAVDLGIISHDTAFYPDRNVSRQEVCKILVIAMKLENTEGANLSVYTDNAQMGEWAKRYISQAVNAKILIGVSQTQFLPLGNVTNEQTAVILERLYKYVNGGAVK